MTISSHDLIKYFGLYIRSNRVTNLRTTMSTSKEKKGVEQGEGKKEKRGEGRGERKERKERNRQNRAKREKERDQKRNQQNNQFIYYSFFGFRSLNLYTQSTNLRCFKVLIRFYRNLKIVDRTVNEPVKHTEENNFY